MKHWIGVMCVGAAFAIAGLALRAGEEEEVTLTSSPDVANQVGTSLLTLGVILGIIGLVGLASNLMKSEHSDAPPPPQG